MIDEKVISKIKKLLELATSPNEHEAKRAMEAAQKLMAQHSLNLLDIEGTGKVVPEIIMSEYYNPSFRKDGLFVQLPAILGTITPIFGVYALIKRNSLGEFGRGDEIFELYGYPTNLEIARFALDSILAQGMLEARAEYRKHRTTTFHFSFWSGFASGLHQKFSEFKDQSNSLIVYDPVRLKVSGLAKGSIHSQSFDGSAYESGFDAGQRAEIRKGLQSTNTGKMLN